MKRTSPSRVLAGTIDCAQPESIVSRYALRLFVAGTTPHSARAIVNVRKICDEFLDNRYDLEVVDISRDPELARDENVIATPTLIKTLPFPPRRFVGDLSRVDKLLPGLGLEPATGPACAPVSPAQDVPTS